MVKDLLSRNAAENLYSHTGDKNIILVITLYASESMETESRKIRIYIKSKDKKKKDVAVTVLVNFLQQTQNILYRVCEEIVEKECHHSGRYLESIKEHCELVVKSIEFSSNDVVVGLSQTQKTLPFPEFPEFKLSLGEKAILKTKKIIDVIQSEDDIYSGLSSEVSDEGRKYHILSAINDMWPDADSRYDYEIGVGQNNLQKMNPITKSKIEEALGREPASCEKTVYGRLVELNVTKRHSCQIETTEGKFDCRYEANLEDIIIKNVRHFVSLSGTLKDSHTIRIEREDDIKPIREIPLQQITINGELLDLVTPIKLRVEYDKTESKYLIENEQFDIFSINDNLNAAIDDIKIQINMLWKGYVEEDPSILTEGAIKYRDLIKILLEAK